MLTYICKYTPLELLAALGAKLEEPNSEVEDYRAADAQIHSSVCTHARMLLERAAGNGAQAGGPAGDVAPDGGPNGGYASSTECAGRPAESAEGAVSAAASSETVLTNCCDSIRRVSDIFAREGGFHEMLDLPHESGEESARFYQKELIRLRDRLISERGASFSRDVFLRKWRENAEAWHAFTERTEPFIAVFGARVSDELRTAIRDSMPCPVIDLTCGGMRTIAPPPKEAFFDISSERICDDCESCSPSEEITDDELLFHYAKALLDQVPCTRMKDTSARDALLTSPHMKGIVYNSVKFCDYYSFEYAAIKAGSSIPMLKIESDYTSQGTGQLSTRITAFAESLASRGGASAEGRHKGDKEMAENAIFVGIDSGSTSTNAAAIDRSGNLLAWSIVRTGARAADAAENALSEVKKSLGDRASDIALICATGYGREFIPFADITRTEISCHATGAHFMNPKARCVIDIGGQDSKVICLDDNGNVASFVMNDKCAAGTGRFLEMMAHTLEMELGEMSGRGITWKKDLTISSTCTVFAESEVVGLIAGNTDTDDIIHALDKSVALKTAGMVRRVKGEAPFMMTGGVARNKGVVNELKKRLGADIFISEHPDLTGAVGAALTAAAE